MIQQLQKTNPSCGNINLIDENLCVSNALPIIMSNVVTLSSILSNFINYKTQYDNIITLFSKLSTDVNSTVGNIEEINKKYLEPYTIIQKLSSNWNKEFSLFYPRLFDMGNFDDSSTTSIPQPATYSNWYDINSNPLSAMQVNLNTIQLWLNLNFPNQEYCIDQVINVYVNLYQKVYFQYNFSASYAEQCIPNAGGGTISCNGCGGDPRSAYCNHHTNVDGTGDWCGNPYAHCGHYYTTDTQIATCQGTGATVLNVTKSIPPAISNFNLGGNIIDYYSDITIVGNDYTSPYLYDRHLCRTVRCVYKNDGANWNYIGS